MHCCLFSFSSSSHFFFCLKHARRCTPGGYLFSACENSCTMSSLNSEGKQLMKSSGLSQRETSNLYQTAINTEWAWSLPGRRSLMKDAKSCILGDVGFSVFSELFDPFSNQISVCAAYIRTAHHSM